jgi:hypothetical protein
VVILEPAVVEPAVILEPLSASALLRTALCRVLPIFSLKHYPGACPPLQEPIRKSDAGIHRRLSVPAQAGINFLEKVT